MQNEVHCRIRIPPPTKDQQAQLAKLLWAMDEVIEREIESKNKKAITKDYLVNLRLLKE